MPAGESDAHYYLRSIHNALPSSEGVPLTTPNLNDLTLSSDIAFFKDIAERVRLSCTPNPDTPALPGMERQVSDDEIAKKQRGALAAARVDRGAGAIMQVMITTYNEDTSRSLYRLQKNGMFIPVDTDYTTDSIYNRSRDYIEDIFTAAAIARVVPSAYTRRRAEKELLARFDDRDSAVVLPLATAAARNNSRLRGVWLNQLERISEGLRYINVPTRNEFDAYLDSRPKEYVFTPDLYKIIADMHRKNTGKYRRA